MKKFIVLLVVAFVGFRTLYPAIERMERGEYRKALPYLIEFACLVFLSYNFGGLV